MGTTTIGAAEIKLHGDSINIYVLEDKEPYLGKVRGIVIIRTSPAGDIEIVYSGKNIKITEN